jgi:hypothetical protein
MAIICRQYGILFYNDSKYNVYSLPVTCSAPITGGFVPSHDILDPKGFMSLQKKPSTLSELIGRKLSEDRALLFFLPLSLRCLRKW